MNQLGSIILHVTFVLTFATGLLALLAAYTRRENVYLAARSGVFATTTLFTVTALILWYQLIVGDFSNKYVAAVGEHALPWYYRIAAFWGSETGALLFWTWLLSIFSAGTVRDNRGEKNRELMPWVIVVLMAGTWFFNYLMVFKSDPFSSFLATSPPMDGRGVNPLLRHPLMTIHPPCLLMGFMGFTVPFAFGVAAVITGRLGDDWLIASRKYTIISWTFLTVGLILGGMWAYQELGWGGFWMWDPVENAALIPWFTGTAFLHSAMIQERRNMLRRWNVVLVFLTFLLTIFGTFLTRSQIIKSIHSFAESLLGIDFLIYCGVIVVVGALLLTWRFRELRSENRIDHFFSRESFFILNNWVLVAAAAIVTWGTLFPKLSDLPSVQGAYNATVTWINGAFGLKMQTLTSAVDLGEPWFNKVMAPVGMLLLLLTGVGPLISWRKATFSNFRRHFLVPAMIALAPMIVGTYRLIANFTPATKTVAKTKYMSLAGASVLDNIGAWWSQGGKSEFFALTCISIGIFVLLVNLQEFYRGARLMHVRHGSNWFKAVIELVSKQRRRYGGFIIHIGVVFLYFGFSGMAFQTKTDWQRLGVGDSQRIKDYRLTYVGAYDDRDDEKTMLYAQIVVTQDDDGVPPEKIAVVKKALERLGFKSAKLSSAPGGPLLSLRFSESFEGHVFRWMNDFTWHVFAQLDANATRESASRRLFVLTARKQHGSATEIKRRYRVMAQRIKWIVTNLTQKPTELEIRYVEGAPMQLQLKFKSDDGYKAMRNLVHSASVISTPLFNVIHRQTMTGHAQKHLYFPVVKGVGRMLEPGVYRYAKHEMTTSEVAIWSRFKEDLYLNTKGIDEKGKLMLEAFVNPMVSGMWFGGVLMVLGALIALWPKSMGNILALARRRRKGKAGAAKDLTEGAPEGSSTRERTPASAGDGDPSPAVSVAKTGAERRDESLETDAPREEKAPKSEEAA